jgi:hypothetical protein
MTLKELLNKHSGKDAHLNFWTDLENLSSDNRLLFEEYCAMFFKAENQKAKKPGQVYWLSRTKGDVVPAKVQQDLKISHLMKGDSTMGMDILWVQHDGRAIGYESKWFDDKDSISFSKVANKELPMSRTLVDQLIFVTNARKPSRELLVPEHEIQSGFKFLEEWITREVFDTVKNYVNGQTPKKYKPMTSRPECLPGETVPFYQQALDQHHNDVIARTIGVKLKEISLRILQHWPAASGKGSFPRLAYDMTYEPLWDYKKSYPINAVINPTLTVLKGNLLKHIKHDLALGNDVVHVIYAGDVTKSANTEELQAMRDMAKVFTDRGEFYTWIKTAKNQTVWVHTTVHSYSRLAEVMTKLKKSFYFGHIDEVHHTIQPDYSNWTDCLEDSKCVIQARFMSSANLRIADGKGATHSMGDPSFSDIQIKELDEKTAIALGFKRQSKIISYAYRETDFAGDWLERLDNGSQPCIRLKGTEFVVPLGWWMAADALIKFRLEYFQVNHTKLTLNTVENCNEFARFFDAFRKAVLKTYCGNDTKDPIYKRIMKAKIMVADTHSNSTVKILKEVSAIPDTFKDSFIIHCRLLGEGWDPENGWIDSNMFVDATWSEIRIYQDVNRGSRIGDGSKLINYIVMVSFLNDESAFNKMFGNITKVANALELGVEDIQEHVEFKAFKNIPKGQRMPRQSGSDELSAHDEMFADFLNSSMTGYIKDGKYYEFGSMIHEMVKLYQEEFAKRGLYNVDNGDWVKRDLLKYEIALKYKEFFDQYTESGRRKKLDDIVDGKDFRLSTDTVIQIEDWKEEVTQIAKQRRMEMLKIAKTVDDDMLTDTYKQKYSVVECDPSFMKGNEKYFGLKYSFGDWDDWKVQVSKSSLENAVAGDYEVI